MTEEQLNNSIKLIEEASKAQLIECLNRNNVKYVDISNMNIDYEALAKIGDIISGKQI